MISKHNNNSNKVSNTCKSKLSKDRDRCDRGKLIKSVRV